MIDLHCHILPAVDDGAKSLEIALEMCRIALQDGISHIVATPHANTEFVYDRQAHEARLLELKKHAPEGLDFSLGCDFHFSYENIEDAIAHPDRYTISGTKYLLIELSSYSIPPTWADAMFRLASAGLRTILTHPERNPILQSRPQLVLDWVRAGCIVQVTASSVTGYWGRTAKKISKWLLDHNAVHVLSSDAHDPQNRPPVLSKAVKQVADWASPGIAQALVVDNPRAIVTGQALPYFPILEN